MSKCIVIFLSLVVYLIGVECYSSGAPLTDEICSTLRPNHPGEPQSVKFPYKLRLSSRNVQPGGTVSLEITTRGNSGPIGFRGFLIQGREQSRRDSTPQGFFRLGEKEESNLQTINCMNIENSAVTHRNGEVKKNVTIPWTAPQKQGKYILLTTVVESGKIYWVGIPSPTINVQ